MQRRPTSSVSESSCMWLALVVLFVFVVVAAAEEEEDAASEGLPEPATTTTNVSRNVTLLQLEGAASSCCCIRRSPLLVTNPISWVDVQPMNSGTGGSTDALSDGFRPSRGLQLSFVGWRTGEDAEGGFVDLAAQAAALVVEATITVPPALTVDSTAVSSPQLCALRLASAFPSVNERTGTRTTTQPVATGSTRTRTQTRTTTTGSGDFDPVDAGGVGAADDTAAYTSRLEALCSAIIPLPTVATTATSSTNTTPSVFKASDLRISVEALEGVVQTDQEDGLRQTVSPVVNANMRAVQADLRRFFTGTPSTASSSFAPKAYTGFNFWEWNTTGTMEGATVQRRWQRWDGAGAPNVVAVAPSMGPLPSCAMLRDDVTAPATPNTTSFGRAQRWRDALLENAVLPCTMDESALQQDEEAASPRDGTPPIVARLRFDARITVCLPATAFLWDTTVAQEDGSSTCGGAPVDGAYGAAEVQRLAYCTAVDVVVPKRISDTVRAAQVLSVVAASVSLVAAAPSGVGALATLDAQTLAVLSLMSCNTRLDRTLSSGLRFFVSPVIDLTRFTVVLVINAQVALLAIVGHFLLVLLQYRSQTEDRLSRHKAHIRRYHDRRARRRAQRRLRRANLRRQGLLAIGSRAVSVASSGGGGHGASSGSGDQGEDGVSVRRGGEDAVSSDTGLHAELVDLDRQLRDLSSSNAEDTSSDADAGALFLPGPSSGAGSHRRRGMVQPRSGLRAQREAGQEQRLLAPYRRFDMDRFVALCAKLRFPSLSFLVAILAFQGVVFASLHLSFYSRDTSISTIGVIGTLFALLFIVLSTVLVQQQRLRFYPYIELHPWLGLQGSSRSHAPAAGPTDNNNGDADSPRSLSDDDSSPPPYQRQRSESFGQLSLAPPEARSPELLVRPFLGAPSSRRHQQHGSSRKSQRQGDHMVGGTPFVRRAWLAWLYPLGTWGPSRQRLMFSKLFSAYTGSAKLWFVFPLLLAVAVIAIAIVQPETIDGCLRQLATLSSLFTLSAVLTIVRQPMRVAYKNVLSSAAYVCFALSTGARGAYLKLVEETQTGELWRSTADPTTAATAAFRVTVGATIAQVLLLLLRSTLDLVFTYCESKYWRPRNAVYQRGLQAEQRAQQRKERRQRRRAQQRQFAWRERGHGAGGWSEPRAANSGDDEHDAPGADALLGIGATQQTLLPPPADATAQEPMPRRVVRRNRRARSNTARPMATEEVDEEMGFQRSAEGHAARLDHLLGTPRLRHSSSSGGGGGGGSSSKDRRGGGVGSTPAAAPGRGVRFADG